MARGVRFLLGFRQYPFLKKTGPGIPVFGYCPLLILSLTQNIVRACSTFYPYCLNTSSSFKFSREGGNAWNLFDFITNQQQFFVERYHTILFHSKRSKRFRGSEDTNSAQCELRAYLGSPQSQKVTCGNSC